MTFSANLGGSGWDPAITETDLYTWAGKPPANSVPVGKRIRISDLNYSDWYSDGTNWRPKGGQATVVSLDLTGITSTNTSLLNVPGTTSQPIAFAEMNIPRSYWEGFLDFRIANSSTSSKRLEMYLTSLGTEAYPAITATSAGSTVVRGRVYGYMSYQGGVRMQMSYNIEGTQPVAALDKQFDAPVSDTVSVAWQGNSGETVYLYTMGMIYHA